MDAAIVDAATLAEVTTLARPAVALVAARVGRTRLIDNEMFYPKRLDCNRDFRLRPRPLFGLGSKHGSLLFRQPVLEQIELAPSAFLP
jgi:hypothetical protein